MALGAGQEFAGYTIVRQLGSGGMGEVYLARHPRLPRSDALKVLKSDIGGDSSFRERFIREADAVAALDHPHIVTVHDRGDADGQLWIASQYIDGTDAAALLRSRYPAGMPLVEALPIVTAIADALDYAHAQGLLHRDVKPANVLLTQPGPNGSRRAYLADFGIARPLDDDTGLTATNIALGTVAYAAPEQLMGQPLDGRADQYALAATTYHLLTGSPPYEAPAAAVIGNHVSGPIPRLSDRRPDLAALDPALAVALAKDPRERFNSCHDFVAALNAAAAGAPTSAGPSQAGPPPSPNTPPKGDAHTSKGRRPLLLAAAAGAVIATALGVTLLVKGTAHQSDSSAPSPASTSTPPPTPALTFESMKDFVNGYYGRLPAGTKDGWADLGPAYQDKTGLQAYLDFWSTVQSVRLVSVTPRDATSVLARLTYDWKDGHSTTEDRWLAMEVLNDHILIADSAVATSNSTVTVTAAPTTTQSAPELSRYDQEFLSLMAQEGWGCTDNSDPNECQRQMVSFAHQVCSYSGVSIDVIYQNFPVPSYFGPREERRAIANAQQAYPNCTFTGS